MLKITVAVENIAHGLIIIISGFTAFLVFVSFNEILLGESA